MVRNPATENSTREVSPQARPGSWEDDIPDKAHEILGVLFALAALFLFLSLVSYDGLDAAGTPIAGGNIVGVAGEWTAYFLVSILGITAYLLDIFIWMGAACLFFPRLGRVKGGRVLGTLLIALLSSVALHTALRPEKIYGGHAPGGAIGELLGELSISVVSTTGTYILTIGSIIVVLLVITDISLALVLRAFVLVIAEVGRSATAWLFRVIELWRRENEDVLDGGAAEAEISKKNEPPTPELPSPAQGTEGEDVSPGATGGRREESASQRTTEPRIVKKRPAAAASKKNEPELNIDASPIRGTFQLPSVSMLAVPPVAASESDVDERLLKRQADKLVSILSDFKIYGEVREIHPGPVVTMFEFQPRSGTKLSKIESLSNELAMALEVMKVRVVAPIPGKNAVGFELPNSKRETVYLSEMLTDGGFHNKKLKLPMALGKDIGGTPRFVDLAKMPHLLIAGTTGSGKSVSLNAMLVSLLYKYTPDDLRLLLVDPKMVELGIYDGIPHLLLPVVSDMSKACLALKWAVDEMERRYQLFADLSVRNLESYNTKVEKLRTGHEALSEQERDEIARRNTALGVENDEVVVVAAAADMPEKLEQLPFIVIVVDELADLMMVAAKDVETSIARLAQKARAAGLHLIIATQRPSVDVITGLIKANFPSRISFRVSSNHDSRTILGCNGAENLLGMGDMLVVPPGTSDLMRVHGAFVQDQEIADIVAFLKAQGTPDYDDEILRPRDDEDPESFDDGERDEVYDQAVSIVAEAQVCSISMLQRRLRIGYNRSARIVEQMEREGVIGPPNGSSKREVLISPH